MQICNIEATKPSFSFKLPHVTYHLLHAIEQEHEFCSFRTTATKTKKKSHNRFVFCSKCLFFVLSFVCTFCVHIIYASLSYNMNLNTIMMCYICNKRKWDNRQTKDFYQRNSLWWKNNFDLIFYDTGKWFFVKKF